MLSERRVVNNSIDEWLYSRGCLWYEQYRAILMSVSYRQLADWILEKYPELRREAVIHSLQEAIMDIDDLDHRIQ